MNSEGPVGTNIYLLLVVLIFFGLLAYSIHKEDKRTTERRKLDIPPLIERRRQDRRDHGPWASLGWSLRSLWFRRTKP